MAVVVPFRHQGARTSPPAQFIRLGDHGARALADLFAAGHFRPRRVVVDASRFDRQRELVDALHEAGVEIVLDPKTAELAAPGRFTGRVREAPWAEFGDGAPLGPDRFGRKTGTDVTDAIARFVATRPIDAVLAPTHWLGDPDCEDWLERDLVFCGRLRDALDREGARRVAIDYALLLPQRTLQDGASRRRIIERLADAPHDALWVRASGFGNNAAPLTTRRHIEALTGLHGLGRPVVADCVGGLTGAALLAFGAASAVAHGIGAFEAFDAGGWRHAAPRDEGGGGRHRSQSRVSLAGINRSVTARELRLLASARGGRRHVACDDRECCPGGLEDTLRNPRRHAARQSVKPTEELARVPDLRRAEHFVEHQLVPAERRARRVARLKPDPKGEDVDASKVESLMKRLEQHAESMERGHSALERFLNEGARDLSRAEPVRDRQAQPDLFSHMGL